MSLFSQALHALGFAASPHAVIADALGGVLTSGQFYRVWARVKEAYVKGLYDAAPEPLGQTTTQEQLALDLVPLGFSHAVLVIQDPSDPEIWTFLTRWTAPQGTPNDTEEIHFLRFDPVEAPAPSSPIVDVPSLDVGLSDDNLYTAMRALCHDDDPKRLAGVARCFDEDFPIVASLLRNKARLENLNRVVNRETGPIRVEERASGRMSPESSVDHPTLDALREASCDLDEGSYLDLYANVFHTLEWTPPASAAEHGHEDLWEVEPEIEKIPVSDRETDFGKVATLFSRTPALAHVENIPSLAERTGLSPALLAAGVAAASDHGHGLLTLDPAMVRAMRPHGPRPVSFGALKMAHAILRPEGSLAAAPSELSDVLTDLNKSVEAGDPFALRAEESLKRARRFLDRQNWAAWYKRYHAAESM